MINNNTLRVTGLASGMNTDEIVANLVKVQSSRLNKMLQTKTIATWKSDAYREVNTKIDQFRKSMESLRLQGTFNKQAVTSSDSRVEVASAGTSTQTGFNITEATLATPAKQAMVSFATQMTSGASSIGASEVRFTLNNVEVILAPELTYDQAIAKINEVSGQTNVKAANVGGSLVLTSTTSGQAARVDITQITPEPNTLGISTIAAAGEDATSGSVRINGTLISVNSNKFTYEGVSYTLKQAITTNDPAVSVQIGSDTQAIFDGIKTFVDKYNELIADLNGKLTEKRYRDFPPLTEDQKKDMKENDVKLWEEKARSGLLTSDPTIRSFLTEMRNSLASMVENSGLTGSIKSLKDIGINFSNNYRDNGKLNLDEAKLKGVLQNNLEEVKQLFAGKGTGVDSKSTTVTDSSMHSGSGYAWRIYDRSNLAISNLASVAGAPQSAVDTTSYIARQIKNLEVNILREEKMLSSYERRLWEQFGAMEKSLQKLNSQGAWLQQQLSL